MNTVLTCNFSILQKYCGKKSALGHNVKQLRMVYNAAKRDGMTQLYELIGEERHAPDSRETDPVSLSEETDAAIEGVGDSAMNAPTPSTSAGSESDISEMSESKGKKLTLPICLQKLDKFRCCKFPFNSPLVLRVVSSDNR